MVLPLFTFLYISYGALAHLGERLPCKQEVAGPSPAGSTKEQFSIGSSRFYLLLNIFNSLFFPLIQRNENENGMVRDAALPK